MLCPDITIAAEGHNTLVVSTDPAHSLSDSLDQDVSGGQPVPVEGTDLPIWGMEIDADEARAKFQSASSEDKTQVLLPLVDAILYGALGHHLVMAMLRNEFGKLHMLPRMLAWTLQGLATMFHSASAQERQQRGFVSLKINLSINAGHTGLSEGHGVGHDCWPAGRSQAGGAPQHAPARPG